MGYYKIALEQEPQISSLVKEIADKVGMETRSFDSRMKTKRSYLKKLEKNYSINKKQYQIKDILRYTYISSPDTLAHKTLEAIETYKKRGYITIEIKNYWLMNFYPYNGINTVIVSPNGLKFELQYHTVESYEIRENIHEIYEEWRNLPEISEKAKELNRKMFEGYKGTIVPRDIKKVK
jgi:hypothetical protein